MTGRRLRMALAVASGALALAAGGCGGGGGGEDPAAETAPIDTGIAPATGVGAEESAALAVAALGAPAPVDAAATGRAIVGREAYGEVRDPFDPLVEPADEGDGSPSGEEQDGASAGAGSTTPTVPDVVIPPQIPPPSTVPTAPALPKVPTVPVAPAPVPAPSPAPAPGTPAPVPGGTSGWSAPEPAVVPAPGTDSGRLALTASIDMGGEVIEATRGDAVPPESQRFTVVGITATTVILRLTAGLLPGGDDILTLQLGERVDLADAVTGRPQSITLVGIAAG